MRERIHGICGNCIDGKNCPGLCDAKIAEIKNTYFRTVKEILGEIVELEVAELTEKDIKRINRRLKKPAKRKGLCKTCDNPENCKCPDDSHGIGAYQLCQDFIIDELRGPKYGRCETCIIRVNCSKMCQERLDEFLPEAMGYQDKVWDLTQEQAKLVWNEGIRTPQHSRLIKRLTKEAQRKPWFRDWKRYIYEEGRLSSLEVEAETF